jgi:anti-sigma B factor antagonist
MEITVDELGHGRAALRPHGRLDVGTADELRACLAEVFAAGTRKVVVDLAGVTFLGSAGLAALISGLKRAGRLGGELRIAAPSTQVLMVLELVKLTPVFHPYESIEAAVEGL